MNDGRAAGFLNSSFEVRTSNFIFFGVIEWPLLKSGMRRITGLLLCLGSFPLFAEPDGWTFRTKLELRANYRDSEEAKFPLKFPFPPIQLPVGQTVAFEQTVDPGQHV